MKVPLFHSQVSGSIQGMDLAFTKMNGAGNDFVMVDNRTTQINLSKDQIARLCDRHRGIGADGLICAEPANSAQSHLRMRYYNADGGEAEMCGNGARCFSRFGASLTPFASKPSPVRFKPNFSARPCASP